MVVVGGWTWNPWSKQAVSRTFTDWKGSALLVAAIAGSVVALIGLAVSVPVLAVVGAAATAFAGSKYWQHRGRR
jgi:hypothetical protein